MLYATTRDNHTIETAYKVIHTDCAADGGLYVPFRLPSFTPEEIAALASRSFSENVAQMLNIFFGVGLTSWDVEFCIGRAPVKMSTITHRILIAEAWHNNQWKMEHVIRALSDRLRKSPGGVGNWVEIAIRISILFAIYGQILSTGQAEQDIDLDVAVTSEDFAMPMSAWYARQMGLPLNNIICGCNANGSIWDLLHRGEMSCGAISAKTNTPDADIVIPRNLERLVHATLGREAVHHFLDRVQTGSAYSPENESFETFRNGMFASVISDSRVRNIIHSVYRTSNYVFGPYSALSYGSLLDYRAKTGESRPVLLLCERSPICDSELVASAMQVEVPELIKCINFI